MTSSPARQPSIAVIGAGPMGLAVAYELARRGHPPTLFEADDRIGGMAACFDFEGIRLERYYHFHCLSDHAFFALLEELDLQQEMAWRQTSMGFFCNDRLYPWGSVGAVLAFPRLPLLTKIRYLLHAARCLTIRDWHPLDRIPATGWLRTWLGESGYRVLWHKLFAYKFFHHTEEISAAWIWSRIRRLARSRRRLKETLGFLRGGTQQYLDAMEAALKRMGTKLELAQPIRSIRSLPLGGVALGTSDGEHRFDAVISTVPMPLVAPMLSAGGPPPELVKIYAGQRSVACACVVIKTSRPITANFWTNVNDERFHIPGIIEMGNLRPLGAAITYVPFYMPADHPDYLRPNEAFIADAVACLLAINPSLSRSDVVASHCSRYRYAQPVCGMDFLATLPPLEPLPNLWIADTTVYYPEDRGISESTGFGRKLAAEVLRKLDGAGEPPA
jgi:protoporphyrinogen oxidase